jgi:hypothetical protein
MPSVSPDIIDDIARDFRLGVQTSPGKAGKATTELDLAKAAQTMLALYARLQAEQRREELKDSEASATRGTDYGTKRLKR